ncbi:MAG: hypothetical protein LBR70_04820 [Lactobacillaceae bacterium]|jgi:hypothetical protein|nr:hypothetical protein [Lactobacillaceae bacterium]
MMKRFLKNARDLSSILGIEPVRLAPLPRSEKFLDNGKTVSGKSIHGKKVSKLRTPYK